jgi:hypothetical protein
MGFFHVQRQLMSSPLYPLLETKVEDLWRRLDYSQISPWAFLAAGPLFRVADFHGRVISYQGIAFEGSPRQVFWGGYIEPFLEDLTEKIIKETLVLADERKQDAKIALSDASGLAKSVVRRAYGRMADIDRRLRGKGFPESLAIRSVELEIAGLDEFINKRIAAELAMIRPRWWINDFYSAHPFLFWLIALAVGALVSFTAT